MSATEAPTALAKHSVLIAGHRTSVSLEAAFWQGLQTIARRRGLSTAALIAEIDAARGSANLSSAIRVHVFQTLACAEPVGGPHAYSTAPHRAE